MGPASAIIITVNRQPLAITIGGAVVRVLRAVLSVGVVDAAAGVLRAMLAVLIAGGIRVVGVLAEFAEVFIGHGRKSKQHAQHDHDISHQIFLVEVFLASIMTGGVLGT